MFGAILSHVAGLYRGGFMTVVVERGRPIKQWAQIDPILAELEAVDFMSFMSTQKVPPSSGSTCNFQSVHPVTNAIIYCPHILPGRARHSLCPLHLRFHDRSHHLYKALEGKVQDRSLEEVERAWGLQLAHVLTFFGGAVDEDHTYYMTTVVDSHLSRHLFPGEQDLWNLLPSPSAASDHYSYCHRLITNQHLTSTFITILSRLIFRGLCDGKTWVVGPATPAIQMPDTHMHFPQTTFFNYRFFLARLSQKCPFIFRAVTNLLVPLTTPTSVSTHSSPIAEFYTPFAEKLANNFALPDPSTSIPPSNFRVETTENWEDNQ